MLKKGRFALALGLAGIAVLALGTTLAGAAYKRGQVDVAIRIAASPRPTAVGANLTYTLTLRNSSASRAQAVVVRDRLPAGVTFVSAEASKGSCSGTSIVTCSLGGLARDAVAHVTIVVQPTRTGRIVNTASIRALQRDRAAWNNQATLTTIVGPAANLGLTLAATPRPATLAQPLTYTLTVRNLSAVAATNVVLTSRIPVRSTFVSASSSQGSCTGTVPVTCALGSIAAGATAQVTIVAQPTGTGYVTAHGSVKSDEGDPNRLNNSRTTTVRVHA
ncbi:MAG: DUF11 domain-containing protein [Gaiellaceae bacterium]